MRAAVAVFAALLLTACPAPEGHVYSVSSPSASANTRALLQPLVDSYQFNGELRISGGPLDGAKLGRGEIWPWASVTKQVIATLVMQDVMSGQLSLDTPVSAYLASWPSSGPVAPTLRQLLQHQSGLYDPEDDPEPDFNTARALEPIQCVERRSKAPGGQFNYNNCDTLVVGLILESVNGSSIEELFASRIVNRAGLMETAFVTPATRLAESKTAAPPSTIALYGAAGGLAGTTWDLIRFDEALMDGRLLSDDAREEMWDGVPELGYTALGQWETVLPLEGCSEPVRVIERRGAVPGYQARNFIIPDRRIAIAAFIANGEDDYSFGEPWSGEGFSYELLSAAVCTQ